MKKIDFVRIWSVLLIASGLLFFAQGGTTIRTGSEEDNRWALLWAVLFAVAAVTFLWAYRTDRAGWWWAVIPACPLFGLALIITLGVVEVGVGAWLATLWLGSLSLAFWLVYVTAHERWWAIIPGGVLLTIAPVPLLATVFGSEAIAALIFCGMALTFGLVYVLPTPQGHMTWPLLPAGVLAVFGGMSLLGLSAAINYVPAGVLVLAGLYFLYRERGGGHMARRG